MRNDAQDTYDAYEKDIAIASFYFEEPTAYEYSRYDMSISLDHFTPSVYLSFINQERPE